MPSETVAGFPFSGEVMVGDVADLYGLSVPQDERAVSIADTFADRSDERPLPGMRFPLGNAAMEALEVEEGRVTQAALRFETLGEEGDSLLTRVRRQIRRRAATAEEGASPGP